MMTCDSSSTSSLVRAGFGRGGLMALSYLSAGQRTVNHFPSSNSYSSTAETFTCGLCQWTLVPTSHVHASPVSVLGHTDPLQHGPRRFPQVSGLPALLLHAVEVPTAGLHPAVSAVAVWWPLSSAVKLVQQIPVTFAVSVSGAGPVGAGARG